LEFPTIFIVGLEENIFPSPLSTFSKRELEEERRLLYVAITRAEKHCFLTCAKNRWRYGKMEFDTPSRFIQDIDPALIKVAQEDSSYNFSRDFPRQQNELQRTFAASRGNLRRVSEVVHPSKSPHPQSLFESQNNGLQEGNVIEHDRFGIGTIVKMEGTGENTKATVQFRNVGIKQLLLKFARYKIIG
ncbi:MAG: 3'-5' exonuclease, partial [Prevotellaceae bacterium]|nr:3'-5' exonuclease [Prevotellaceae bacterium]